MITRTARIVSIYIGLLSLLNACGLVHSDSEIKAIQSETSVCVQTFNAYGPAYSNDLANRTTILGKEFQASPCEIIQMQEVWTDSHFNMVVGAVENSLPWISAIRFDNIENPYEGKSGLSIFTSDSLSNEYFEKFKVNQDGILDEVRGVLGVIKGIAAADVTLRNDASKSLHMMNLHTHPTSTAVRIAQVVQLLKRFESLLPLTAPVVITGDFNFKPDSVEYNLMRDVGSFTDSFATNHSGYRQDDCTYCADNPHHWGGGSRVIDYIWLRSSSTTHISPRDTIVNLRGIEDTVPSDHFGLRTQVQFTSARQGGLSRQEVGFRCNVAITAIDSALTTLVDTGEGDSKYQDSIASLRAYKSRFQRRLSTDSLIQQLYVQ